jgi:ABC-type nitrate/sulfonate/bicarbonate transport system substrate-binding protein
MHKRSFHTRRQALGLGASLGAACLADRLTIGSSVAQPMAPLKVVNSAGVVGGAIQAVMKERGYGGEFGLDLTYLNVADGSKIISGLLGGDADVCMWSGFPQVLPAIERGGKLRIIAGALIVPVQAVFSSKPEIKSVLDLTGKTIGSGAPGSLLHQAMVALLRKYGVNESKVQFVNIGASPDVFRGVVRGTVDAGLAEVDVFDQQEQFGVHVLKEGQLWDELPNFTWQAAYTTTQVISQKRDLLVRALAAHAKLYRYVSSPESWESFSRGRTAFAGKDDPVPARTYWNFIQRRQPFAVDLVLNEERINWVQELNVSLGLQRRVVPYDQVADMSIARDALRLIGAAK